MGKLHLQKIAYKGVGRDQWSYQLRSPALSPVEPVAETLNECESSDTDAPATAAPRERRARHMS